VFRPEGDEDEKESCDSKLTFLLTTAGYAVGIGNVFSSRTSPIKLGLF